ncbi:MAG: immunoglobulin domain-containing protein, partial [Limisphaerales bacterium]
MPSDRITYPGSIVNLRPEVEGTAPMNFQWCRDGAPVAGLTDENLVLGNVQTNQAGAYTLVISNQFWVSTSSVVNVSFTSVPYRPRIWAFLNDNYNFGGRPGVSTESTGAFAQVYDGGKDMLQWSSTDLSPFDAAVFEMMFADSAYDSLGDRMADFVDSGGGLVATVFRGSKQTFGRLTSDHYLPFTTGGADSEPFAGVVFDTPSHPMLDGVKPYTSVWGDYHGIGIGVVPGSSLVAHWSDGSPFLGTKQKAGSGRVVGYNSEDSTDPLRLVVNSWLWAARAPAPEPKIVSEPASVGVTPGTFASVVAYVSGASPMGFQWYRNGSLVPGAMDSAFNVVYPQMGDDATYTYVATNAYGSVASTATVLTVQIAPSITAQPQSLTVHSGNSASLSVGATGTSLQYQWYKNGDVLAGATSATLSIGNVSVADDADYSVQVSNLVGSEASLTVHLTVLTAPIFLQQPASQTVQAGGAVTLSCNVGPDTVLPTVSSGNLRLWLDANAKVDADSNNFVSRWGDCSSNHWNAAQSDPNWQPVLTHPDALHGRAAMHFEDYQITGSFLTNSTLSFHGAYTAFLVYSHDTGGAGFMTPFQMDSFDADEFTNGESHPFSGFALWPNGEIGVITWDWIDSGISMPANMWHVETLRQHTDAVVDVTSQSANAATNTTLVEGGNYLWQSGYHLGRLAGDIAEVIVYEGALSDVDQAAVGQFLNDKYFLNNVRGFGFQWQLNGVDIAGATNQTLQLSDVQASQGGTYTVVVTDNGGTSTSVGAVVTVNGPGAPQIVVQPQTHAVNFGDTVSVFVTTSGNSPMAYQWFKDGSLVSGATDSSYT